MKEESLNIIIQAGYLKLAQFLVIKCTLLFVYLKLTLLKKYCTIL